MGLLIFSGNCQKISTANAQICIFLQNRNVKFSGFFAFSRIQGCFYWLPSPIRSGAMADQT